MKVYTITERKLLEWYFDSGEESTDIILNLADRMVDSLKNKNKFKITTKDIFNECHHGDIELGYLEEFSDDDDRELDDLDHEWKLKLIKKQDL